MSRRIKNIAFIILMTMLSLPMFQHLTKLFHPGELHGAFVLSEYPEFTWKSWMDGTYQSAYDRYTEDHIGFRSFFVRLNNQIQFSLYHKTNAEGIVIGKDNILHEYDYIRAYTGEDFMGKEMITENLQKVKFLQVYLKNTFNIDFILMFEPSKARVYPETIPDSYLENGISLSNYEFYTQKARELKVDFIDLNSFFMQVRDTSRYPLYPPYGIHWSEYTLAFVTDTLIKYIEDKQKIDLPEFEVETRLVKDSISHFDYDAGQTLNLLFRLPHPKLPYCFYSFKDDSTKTRPMVLAVADSYYWNIFNTRVPLNLFTNQAFWYFNSKVYPEFYFKDTWTQDLDLKTEIEKQDVIILGVTERFLYKFGWDFVRQVYKLYSPEYTGDVIEKYVSTILGDAVWFSSLLEKSKTSEIPIQKVVEREAGFLANKHEHYNYITWYGSGYFANLIEIDSVWKKSIQNKALESGLTYEQQLQSDAMWTFKNREPEAYNKYKLIQKYLKIIASDVAWQKLLKNKSDETYIPTEVLININAEKLANKELSANTEFDIRVYYYENLILKNPEWLKKVAAKANEQNSSLYNAIHSDALYMAKQELKRKGN